MDTTLSLISPAKLNLFLHINRKRSANERFPGYHELQSVFQLLDRGDVLHFTLQPNSGDITLSPDIPDLPPESNLIYRAAQKLKAMAAKPDQLPGVHVHIEKHLPLGGGLGGGSSNAATTLLALNSLWQLQLDETQLAEIGASLGADVPIFVRGRSAWAEGIGEQLTPLQLSEPWYVILCPDCHVNTAKIFSHERLTRDTPKMKIAPALEGQDNKQPASVMREEKFGFQALSETDFLTKDFHNDFEALVSELYPDIAEAIDFLGQYAHSRLTGTGACCFARFDSESAALQVLNEARSKFKGFIAKGVNLSPAIQRLNEAERSQ